MQRIASGHVQSRFKRFDDWALSQFVTVGQIDCAVQDVESLPSFCVNVHLLGLFWLCSKAFAMFLLKSLDGVGSSFQGCSRWSQNYEMICRKKKKSILNTQGSQLSMWMQIDRHHFACSLNLFQSDVHTGIFSKCGMSIIVNKNQHLKGGLFILLYDAWWMEVSDTFV